MCSAYNFAEVHQFPRNSGMEFSEYLQLDRMAHWPRFLRHPLHRISQKVNHQTLCRKIAIFKPNANCFYFVCVDHAR